MIERPVLEHDDDDTWSSSLCRLGAVMGTSAGSALHMAWLQSMPANWVVHACSGRLTSVSRSPCAAADPLRPPPYAAKHEREPTAIAAPVNGPAT